METFDGASLPTVYSPLKHLLLTIEVSCVPLLLLHSLLARTYNGKTRP
jgi:hypothetical protein